MEEIILIERYTPAYKWWRGIVKYNRISDLTAEQLVQRYKGFEGNLITYFPNEENFEDLPNFYKECLEFKKISANLMLLHLFSEEKAPTSLEKIATKVGYDVGFLCCESSNIYSSIFNEILLGDQDELVVYREYLNENLLFDTPSCAKKYVAQHKVLEDIGRDVERDPMIIYEVWQHLDLESRDLDVR
ncbi:MAG: hypothetical protein ACSNEK_08625 [Parachlamydiaceae bacterium]